MHAPPATMRLVGSADAHDLGALLRESFTRPARFLYLAGHDRSHDLAGALARRLDRMTRQIERLERHIDISNEALALFVRFWLTSTPPLPDAAQPAAQAKGRERYQGFVEALGRRLARGRKLADEIIRDVSAEEAQQNSDGGTS